MAIRGLQTFDETSKYFNLYIHKLLCRNPNARLGAKNGVEEIK